MSVEDDLGPRLDRLELYPILKTKPYRKVGDGVGKLRVRHTCRTVLLDAGSSFNVTGRAANKNEKLETFFDGNHQADAK